jgi:hypothetical protein
MTWAEGILKSRIRGEDTEITYFCPLSWRRFPQRRPGTTGDAPLIRAPISLCRPRLHYREIVNRVPLLNFVSMTEQDVGSRLKRPIHPREPCFARRLPESGDYRSDTCNGHPYIRGPLGVRVTGAGQRRGSGATIRLGSEELKLALFQILILRFRIKGQPDQSRIT